MVAINVLGLDAGAKVVASVADWVGAGEETPVADEGL